MLEITSDDIALLDDGQLRAVVARLCEAELRQRGQSAAHVTWGGNQNARDGGIDIRVDLPPGSETDGYIPRPQTGFQVKQQDMPASEITDEMCPNGTIRASIQSLADQGGAYIIVSGQGSTSDTALTSRRDAMTNAVASITNADALKLDFYDRTRVATWVRSHDGLIPWVRALIGKAIQGWQSYGSWAYAPEATTTEYLLDDKHRILTGSREDDKGLSALQGIQKMREELHEPQRVVRLVGLSGVGKTRLVQALFDERLGDHSLNPALAIYTNMADDPDPQPIGLISNLVARGIRIIFIVDNCPPDLHQRLSELCRHPDSKVSVITIEYDIREDQPEGTEVFRLETSSPELIEKLIQRRFPSISQIDARTIADFCGGNARIAIALAATVGHHETIAGLTDEQLFQRLFFQRHAPDESLYLIGQACAIVYSFQGQDASEDEAGELNRLAKLIGRKPQELYRGVAELQRRDLVQQRGVWRAVLPHAIANRLAATALQNIPYAELEQQIVTSPRLLGSFSRRLGYLHASAAAVTIVKKWLGIGGLLEDLAVLNELHRSVLINVAPVAPEEVLALLERAILGTTNAAKECTDYCELLRSIAYDPQFFERCVKLMVKIIATHEVKAQARDVQLFTSLFHLVLSGTHATIEQRAGFVKSLLQSPDDRFRALGVLALEAILEASHFQASSIFEFGARSRDFGYWPQSQNEVQHWFGVALRLTEELSCSDSSTASQARTVLAGCLYGLWLHAGVPDDITRVALAIRQQQFWPEGWLAIRQILDLCGKELEGESRARLIAMEATLRPADLLQRVRGMVFSSPSPSLDLADLDDGDGNNPDDVSARHARVEALAQHLGKLTANDETSLQELLPEMVASDGRLWSFGCGLLLGAHDAEELWRRLTAALAATEERARKLQVFNGFLHQLRPTNATLANTLLDRSVEDPTLAAYYPFLQIAVDLEPQDIVRLKRSLELGKAPAAMYQYLAYGRATDSIPAQDLRELILAIAALPSGASVAIEILYMRLFSDRDKGGFAPELLDTGCKLLEKLSFTGKKSREDHRLGYLIKSCLTGERGALIAAGMCQRLKNAVAKREASTFYHDDLLGGLFSAQPLAALEALCGGNEKSLKEGIRILREGGFRTKPLDVVSADDLIAWCKQQPEIRYPAIPQLVTGFQTSDNKAPRWTTRALRLMEEAPDPEAVLREFTSQFTPVSGWSGSLAAILEVNAGLLDQLGAFPKLRDEVERLKERLRRWVEEERRRENAADRELNERFE